MTLARLVVVAVLAAAVWVWQRTGDGQQVCVAEPAARCIDRPPTTTRPGRR